jgi:hypothetical protein
MDQSNTDRNSNPSRAFPSDCDQVDGAELMDDAKQRLHNLTDRQKAAGAEQIKTFAHAFHKAAENLDGNSPGAASYVRYAAARLDRFSSTVRDRSLDELMGQVRDFARVQPVAFFGGAVVAGFALTRFLKSSGENPPGPSQR